MSLSLMGAAFNSKRASSGLSLIIFLSNRFNFLM